MKLNYSNERQNVLIMNIKYKNSNFDYKYIFFYLYFDTPYRYNYIEKKSEIKKKNAMLNRRYDDRSDEQKIAKSSTDAHKRKSHY